MIRNVFQPTFGNISDWECSHCGLIWESSQLPRKCPQCTFDELLRVYQRTWDSSGKAACAKYN